MDYMTAISILHIGYELGRACNLRQNRASLLSNDLVCFTERSNTGDCARSIYRSVTYSKWDPENIAGRKSSGIYAHGVLERDIETKIFTFIVTGSQP